MTKHLIRWSLLATVITTIVLCCASCGIAYAESIEEYEQEIQNNNCKIEQLETIKEQLHITAELLRQNEDVNNGTDTVLSEKWSECDTAQQTLKQTNVTLNKQIEQVRVRQRNKTLVGNFTITHYCPCNTCNGGYNKTATGTTLTPYKTIAVDPKIIPLGSKVEINGQIYIAEDTGGAIKGNKIDMCVSTHLEALQRGLIKNVPVYIINE